MVYSELGIGCSIHQKGCEDSSGCPDDVMVDFCIKRNDTTPAFKLSLEDCEGVVELHENHVLQVNIWIKTKLKNQITETDTEISFADNIGFEQILENNIIIMDRSRNPEKMLVTGFDETNKKITVQRGYDGTVPQVWPKGSLLRVFRATDAEGEIEFAYEDIEKEDGTVDKDQLVNTFLVFKWLENTTSLAGCFWLEFKLIELNEEETEILSVRRFPSQGEGFLIRIINSPT